MNLAVTSAEDGILTIFDTFASIWLQLALITPESLGLPFLDTVNLAIRTIISSQRIASENVKIVCLRLNQRHWVCRIRQRCIRIQ